MIDAIGAHLWQSTLFAVLAAALTLAFRRHGARIRYALWLAASVKFLIPFATLAAIGAELSWLSPIHPSRSDRVVVARTVTGPSEVPFPPPAPDLFARLTRQEAPFAEATGQEPFGALPAAIVAVWLIGFLGVLAVWSMRWWRIQRLVNSATATSNGSDSEVLRRFGWPLPVRIVDPPIEPGVFGVMRPVLVWPRGLVDHLLAEQVQAILAHELAHVGRRDNLVSAIQTLVQAIFWFHPLIWWIGARLVDERERACDEAVLQGGTRPHVYAEGILRTCRFYVEAPAACVAGVTGSDLKRRIERIVHGERPMPVGRARKALLAAAVALSVLVPVGVGAVTAPLDRGPVRLERAIDERARQIVFSRPGGLFRVSNFTVRELIRLAYPVPDQYIRNAPAWIDTERFDLETPLNAKPSTGDVQALVRDLLAKQFDLALRVERWTMPAYVLTRAGGELGPRLRSSHADCAMAPPTGVAGVEPCDLRLDLDGYPNNLSIRGVTMAQFAEALNRDGLVRLDRPVVDRTGLEGRFDIELGFARGPHSGRDSLSARAMAATMRLLGYPDLFDAFEQQLGLRLEALDAPVDVLVVVRVTRPDGSRDLQETRR